MENVSLTSVNREVPLPTADLSVWEGIPWWASEWLASAEVITESFPTCWTTGAADLLLTPGVVSDKADKFDSCYQKDSFISSKRMTSEGHKGKAAVALVGNQVKDKTAINTLLNFLAFPLLSAPVPGI